MDFLSNLPVGAEVILVGRAASALRWLNWHRFEIVAGDHSTYRLRRFGPPGPWFDADTFAPIPEPVCPKNIRQLIRPVSS